SDVITSSRAGCRSPTSLIVYVVSVWPRSTNACVPERNTPCGDSRMLDDAGGGFDATYSSGQSAMSRWANTAGAARPEMRITTRAILEQTRILASQKTTPGTRSAELDSYFVLALTISHSSSFFNSACFWRVLS